MMNKDKSTNKKLPIGIVALLFSILGISLIIVIYGFYTGNFLLGTISLIIFIFLFPVVKKSIEPYSPLNSYIYCKNCSFLGCPVPFLNSTRSKLLLILLSSFGILEKVLSPDIKCPKCNNTTELARANTLDELQQKIKK